MNPRISASHPCGSSTATLRARVTGARPLVALVFGAMMLASSGMCLGKNVTTPATLGQAVFEDTSLSADGKIACASCHDAKHAYADPRPRSVGVYGRMGTRNAPGLIGIGQDSSFAWDGRRARLEDVVMDPFTNPVELGLDSMSDALRKIHASRSLLDAFRATYPEDAEPVTAARVSEALATFVRSLGGVGSTFEPVTHPRSRLAPEAERGRKLFEGAAGCSRCHLVTGDGVASNDGLFHHSGIGESTNSAQLPRLAREVVSRNLDATQIGPRVLTDLDWSALGRFVVSHQPADIGAFRTPSLRNVALTGPYMHDGSKATLQEAVDHEIYYHGLNADHPINLAQNERRALIEFLESLTDSQLRESLIKSSRR